jgi:hypothetical protein
VSAPYSSGKRYQHDYDVTACVLTMSRHAAANTLLDHGYATSSKVPSSIRRLRDLEINLRSSGSSRSMHRESWRPNMTVVVFAEAPMRHHV